MPSLRSATLGQMHERAVPPWLDLHRSRARAGSLTRWRLSAVVTPASPQMPAECRGHRCKLLTLGSPRSCTAESGLLDWSGDGPRRASLLRHSQNGLSRIRSEGPGVMAAKAGAGPRLLGR